jgi:hypothetical protein
MATWSAIRTGLTILEQVTSDGVNLYFLSNGTDIYRYTPGTDTLTQISSSATWTPANAYISANSACNLCWFGGALYVAMYNDNGAGTEYIQAWKYTGSSWSKVYEDSDSSGGSTDVDVLMSDDNYIVIAYMLNSTRYYKHSTDGSSWDDSAVPASTDSLGGSGFFHGNDTTFGIFCNASIGSDLNHVVQFNAGTWDDVYNFGSGDGFITAQPDWCWVKESATFKHTIDFSSFIAPADTTTQPAQTYNMPYSVGFRFGSPITIYLWDTSAGQWSASPEDIDSGLYRHAVRTDDNEVYVLLSTAIYERSEPLPDASPYALTHSAGGIPGAILIA